MELAGRRGSESARTLEWRLPERPRGHEAQHGERIVDQRRFEREHRRAARGLARDRIEREAQRDGIERQLAALGEWNALRVARRFAMSELAERSERRVQR